MKKLFTLLGLLFLQHVLQAQTTTNLILDYDAVDEHYALQQGYDYQRFYWGLNKNYPNANTNTVRTAAVLFDSIVFVNSNQDITYIPRNKAALTLDSFSVPFMHENHTGSSDTIKFTVFSRTGLLVSGAGTPQGTFTYLTTLWDTVIVTNSSLGSGGQPSVMTFNTGGISLPQSQTFGIQVDFSGDTADKFEVVAGGRDECAGGCWAAAALVRGNTIEYLNYTNPVNRSGVYYSGLDILFADCDGDMQYTPGGCELHPFQNLAIKAYVTADVDYGVSIAGDSLKGCPGGVLTLRANAFGSAATPYTYSWSTTNGTLTSTSDEQVSFVFPNTGNAVLTVTVSDANNVTASNTVTIQNKAIGIALTSGSPMVIACGSTATLITTVSGVTTGKNYAWSTGASGANFSTISVNAAGIYQVTVTNSAGCSATTSVSVQYPGNLSNTASFTLPPPPTCEDMPHTFTNTSQKQNGWNATWLFGDGNVGFTTNGINLYTNPGVYQVKLQMDSGGCTFNSVTANLQILSASNAACQNHFVAFFSGGSPTVCNGSDVLLDVDVYNGTGPYSYSWSATGDTLSCTTCAHPHATINTVSNFTVTVTDANNEIATASVFYYPNGGSNQLQVSVTGSQINCSNPTSNTIVTVTGGTGPYTFNWGNGIVTTGASPQTYNYTSGGEYIIAVADSANCIVAMLNTVDYAGIAITIVESVEPLCEHTNTGKVKISAANGTPPYTFAWSNGATADSAVNIAAGNYVVTVTDATACSASALIQLAPATGWGYYVYLNTAQPNCSNNGQISTSLLSGTAPYTYLWSNGSTTPTLTALGAGIYSVTVTDSLGCAAMGVSSMSANCASIIQGTVFTDNNNNCVANNGETPLYGAVISASRNGATYFAITDTNGFYSISVPSTGAYHITVNNTYLSGTCGQFSLCGNSSSTITITTAGDSSLNNNIAYTNLSGIDYGLQVIWSVGNPGFAKVYRIYPVNHVSNVSNANAVVTFKYDANLIYQGSNPSATHNLSTHTLTWYVDSISTYPYYSPALRADFIVGANTPLSYSLQSDFSITPTTGDCDTLNNYIHTSDIVTGSFDPNEKEVEPKGAILEDDSVLTYTIHFQNTGTDSTHFVIVRDTLSQNLDPASVNTIAASHPYSDFSISGQGILTWTFNTLRLPDSTTDAEGSKGFIKFTIKKKHNLPIGSIISNTAHIYFDYNAPVVTNTVSDTMSLPNYIFEVRNDEGITVKAFPNPFSDKTSIVVEGLKDKFSFELYDLTGGLRKLIRAIETARFELQRDELAAGVYFYRINNGNGKQAYGRLVVQ